MGDGTVIEQASVLIKEGKIAQVFTGSAPEIGPNQAEVIDGAGKTLLPGFIDMDVHLGNATSILEESPPSYARELSTQLYCGVTGVRQIGEVTDELRKLAASIQSGGALGPEVFFAGDAEKGKPSLSLMEAVQAKSDSKLLDRPLLQQVTTRGAVELAHKVLSVPRPPVDFNKDFGAALMDAYRSGQPLVVGSNAGGFLLAHGPAFHRELQLWVAAGIPPAVALQAATYNAAKALDQDQRIGLIAPGHDANLVLVEGNPLQDISSTEHISIVFFHGEPINRAGLLKPE